jgi:hypothetical protein
VRASLIGIGTIAVAAGLLLTLAGLNIIAGTRMSGDSTWAIIGPIVAVLGMLVLLFGFRPSDPSDAHRVTPDDPEEDGGFKQHWRASI